MFPKAAVSGSMGFLQESFDNMQELGTGWGLPRVRTGLRFLGEIRRMKTKASEFRV